jgi:hypothetical protein
VRWSHLRIAPRCPAPRSVGTLGDGGTVEGVPAVPPSDDGAGEEIDDTGYRRWISVDGRTLDMTDVREAAIVRPVQLA